MGSGSLIFIKIKEPDPIISRNLTPLFHEIKPDYRYQ